MPIPVECDVCGKKYRVPDERAGRTIPCKDCGSDIDVPGGDDDELPRRRRAGGGKKKKSSGGGAPVALIAGIGGGVVVLVVVAVLVLMRPKQNPVNQPDPLAANQNAAPVNVVPQNPGVPPVAHNPPNAVPNPNANPAPPVANPNPQVAANPANTKAAGSGFKGGNSGGLKAGFEFKPPQNWKVEVDPAKESVTYDPTRKFSQTIKAGYASDDSVIYPVTPSPFAIIGDNDGKSPRDVWNLATGAKAGSLKGQKISGSNVALSPDGKLVAWFRFDNGGGVEVYDASTKKTLGAVSVDSKKFNMTALAIPSNNRMVAYSDVHRSILSWKLPSGDLEHEQVIGENGQPSNQYAFSPGGRYGAIVKDFLAKTVAIYDFDKGEFAGELAFVKSPITTLLGMGFSNDGQEFAIVFDGEGPDYGERILFFKTTTGLLTESITLEEGVKKEHNLHGKETGLQWFPNGKQLLLHGVAIVDRDSKKVVYSLGKSKLDAGSSKNRHVLDNGLIAVWEGTRTESTVQLQQIKSEDISKSVAAMEAGGLMIDAKLPKLTKFDLSAVTDRTDDRASGWNAQPDSAAAAPAALLSSPLPLKGSGQPRGFYVSRPEAGLGFVRFAEGEDANDLKNRRPELRFRATKKHTVVSRARLKPIHCKKNWIEVYDLAKRDSRNRIEVDFSCELLAASPDGKRVLVAPHDGQGRVDVYATENGEHVAGCRPFQEEPKDENRWIDFAFFLDSDHVGVINFEDRLVVWKLPDCKPLYEIKDAISPLMSPGGKSLAVAIDNRVELRDPQTGSPQGAIEMDAPVKSFAFHPKGDRMAVITDDKKGAYLHEVDVKSGRAGDPIPVPTAADVCHWCGDDYLLFNNTSLFDVKQKTIAWTYEMGDPNGIHVPTSLDGRHWYSAKAARGSAVQLVAAELPDTAAKAKLAGAKLEPKTLVQPGGSVTVMAKIQERPDRPGFQAEALGLLNKAVERSGVKDAKGQPIKLAVEVEFKQGNMVPIQFFGGGRQQNTQLQEKSIEITVAYDFNGTALWKTTNRIGNLSHWFSVPSIENAQKAVDDSMWDRTRGYIDSLQLPAYVFSQESVYGLGTSTLSGDGAQAKGK